MAQAELDRSYTVIRAPFACRFSDVSIEPNQFLNTGEVLFEAHGTAAAEIPVQIPMGRVRILLPPGETTMIGPQMDMERMRELFNIGATIRISDESMSSQ